MNNQQIINNAIAALARVNTPEVTQEFVEKIQSLDELSAIAYINRINPLWFAPSNAQLGKKVY